MNQNLIQREPQQTTLVPKHSWQLSYKRLDQLWFSLMALGHHYYVKEGFKQNFFDPTIDNGLKLAFINATYCHFLG